MAELLKDEDMDQLEQWIGTGHKTFTLLYKISRDGCNPATFHQKCDNQGPTVTVLYNQQQTVYGGYTSQSWKGSTPAYIPDNLAFLFRLHFNGKPSPVRMPGKGNGYAVYYRDIYGPTFGGGHDIYSFSGTINATGGYFALNGYVKIGHTYDLQGLQVNDIYNGNMNVTDLEVYKVTAGQREKKQKDQIQQTPWRRIPALDDDVSCSISTAGQREKKQKDQIQQTPWRRIPALDDDLISRLEEYVVNFTVNRHLKIKQAKILLTGPVGAGKSSWCNTINSILRGIVTQKAFSGSAEESVTTQYTQYVLRTRSSAKLNFQICDTRGLEERQGIDREEFSYLLDGHIPNHYEFHPTKPITPGKNGFIATPTRADKIHMVVFVLDASTLDVLQGALLDKIKNFQKIGQQKGIPQVIVLTQIDKVCQEAALDLSCAFKSTAVEKVVEKAAETFGLPRSSVLPVKNYENEFELQNHISGVALLALRQILRFTEDYLENMQDELEEEEDEKD